MHYNCTSYIVGIRTYVYIIGIKIQVIVLLILIMKIKVFSVLYFAIIIFTDAVEVTDEDINSPLASHLLAKLQQLESKIMARPNIRNTRQTTEKPTKPPVVVAADNKQCNCPPAGVVTYTRWGNSTCPYGAGTIYSGVMAGSYYGHEGSAVDPLCIPKTLSQQYLEHISGYQNYIHLYAAKYITFGPLLHSHSRSVPCALCQVNGHTNKILIPSRYECPAGWRREYYGYLMAGHYNNKAATQFTCVDKSVEPIAGSGGNTNGYRLYTVEANNDCGDNFLPCSSYELTCVVCTK